MMTEYVVPCDTIARLSHIFDNFPIDVPASFKTFRIDGGQVVATDRSVMAIDNIGRNTGLFHMIPDPQLIEQCREEAKYQGVVTITVNEALQFATAKTTFGFNAAGNVGYWLPVDPQYNRWREVVMLAKDRSKKSQGAMFWSADQIAKLSRSSPSGCVVFEENINSERPTIMRDVTEYDWLGVFQPYSKEHHYQAATLPTWMVA